MKNFQPKYKFTQRSYTAGILVIFLLMIAYFIPVIGPIADIFIGLWLLVIIIDFGFLINSKKGMHAQRITSNRFSNGDQNLVSITVENRYSFTIKVVIVDEIPIQLQERDFSFTKKMKPSSSITFNYEIRPVKRGIYQFGDIHLWSFTQLGFLKKHYKIPAKADVAVYPSFQQLPKLELLSFADMKNQMGLKRIRHLGYNREFEQVKDYVPGDEIRHINWKASARKSRLMVNQFQDEKSQSIYCVIDMGRTMEMPFKGMSLLDYAINASLALSQVVLKNDDKVGLITYNTKIQTLLPAEKTHNHLSLMMEKLYSQQTRFEESYLDPVYTTIKRKINHRSLFVFFINFESIHSIRRHLPLFLKLSRSHIVLLVNFVNTELERVSITDAVDIEGVFQKTISADLLAEKRAFLNEMGKYGIYTLFESPENIGIQSINKYLAIKARGII